MSVPGWHPQFDLSYYANRLGEVLHTLQMPSSLLRPTFVLPASPVYGGESLYPQHLRVCDVGGNPIAQRSFAKWAEWATGLDFCLGRQLSSGDRVSRDTAVKGWRLHNLRVNDNAHPNPDNFNRLDAVAWGRSLLSVRPEPDGVIRFMMSDGKPLLPVLSGRVGNVSQREVTDIVNLVCDGRREWARLELERRSGGYFLDQSIKFYLFPKQDRPSAVLRLAGSASILGHLPDSKFDYTKKSKEDVKVFLSRIFERILKEAGIESSNYHESPNLDDEFNTNLRYDSLVKGFTLFSGQDDGSPSVFRLGVYSVMDIEDPFRHERRLFLNFSVPQVAPESPESPFPETLETLSTMNNQLEFMDFSNLN